MVDLSRSELELSERLKGAWCVRGVTLSVDRY
jgi:hypothetical protein